MIALHVLVERGCSLLFDKVKQFGVVVKLERFQCFRKAVVEYLRVAVGTAADGAAFIVMYTLLLHDIPAQRLAAFLAQQEPL
ncbi:hypothetical protein J3L18_22310 [Mucilaginibacter gossypii]|uniref:hypothetical protein n=1 Tax=Mucilaginibacter gossypii TaxID=551996 RepID=UPI000DCC1C7D|nr:MULTISPECIES: hypothetical protein [Mucilaginibacter]QTE35861.1 hypothetical protein J3L18_22310 [Mucilaginibacter gossypii]RAV54667.1 hypothetical protein DIU36_19995 [Mucilaginibacter rubeus]